MIQVVQVKNLTLYIDYKNPLFDKILASNSHINLWMQ